MARRLGAIGLVLILGVLAFGLGMASASSNLTEPVTIVVVGRYTHDKTTDVGKKGDSAGDIYTFRDDIYDENNTSKIGADQGMCVRLSPKAGASECWFTTSLPDGQITAQGPFLDDAPVSTYAVTGGTGLYENVRGTLEERQVEGGAAYEFTFDLIP